MGENPVTRPSQHDAAVGALHLDGLERIVAKSREAAAQPVGERLEELVHDQGASIVVAVTSAIWAQTTLEYFGAKLNGTKSCCLFLTRSRNSSTGGIASTSAL